MVYDDHFAEGFAQLFMFLGFLPIFFCIIEIIPLYLILKRTTNRIIQIGILAIILLAGFLLIMPWDPEPFVFVSFLCIGPIATLLPVYIVPDLTIKESRFISIVISYFGVIFFEILLTFTVLIRNSTLFHEFLMQTPLSYIMMYLGILILDTSFAYFVYVFMKSLREGQQGVKEKRE